MKKLSILFLWLITLCPLSLLAQKPPKEVPTSLNMSASKSILSQHLYDSLLNLYGNGSGSTIVVNMECKQWEGTCSSTDFIWRNGKVAIGTQEVPVSFKMVVEGKLGAREIHVRPLHLNWADYVFADDYQLRSLEEVEKHIKKHKHLPDVPTAADVQQQGLDLANMDATLLKKVEELTLYLLQLKKQNDALKQRVETLEKTIQK